MFFLVDLRTQCALQPLPLCDSQKANGSWCAPHERVCVPCAFALCPGRYAFWYVAKGRGQAYRGTAGARLRGTGGEAAAGDEPHTGLKGRACTRAKHSDANGEQLNGEEGSFSEL